MNNMTDEEQKAFNISCAEYMGIEYRETPCGSFGVVDVNFKPATASNDLDRVIEKMLSEKLVEEVCMSVTEGEYMCTFLKSKFTGIGHIQPSMRQAKTKCIEHVLRGSRS